jgi:hypothetical protein
MDAPQFNGEPGPEHDPNAGGHGQPYVCVDCAWTGRGGIKALEHHVNSGHAVRGRRWPASWPNAQFAGVERRQTKRIA